MWVFDRDGWSETIVSRRIFRVEDILEMLDAVGIVALVGDAMGFVDDAWRVDVKACMMEKL